MVKMKHANHVQLYHYWIMIFFNYCLERKERVSRGGMQIDTQFAMESTYETSIILITIVLDDQI